MTDILLYDTKNNITTITLNHTAKRNAFNDQMIKELITLLLRAEEDPHTRVVILAANGKCFSAGADLSWMQAMVDYSEEQNIKDAVQLGTLMHTLYSLTKPTIALIQGPAYGGGIGLIACCDIALASPQANFCFAEVKFGLIPATISPYIVAAMGQRAAQRYFLTAEVFDISIAQHYGLIHEIVAADQLVARGLVIADHLLQNGPQALAASKKLICDVSKQPLNDPELHHKTAEQIANLRVSEEGQEGLMAFLQKRKPKWCANV